MMSSTTWLRPADCRKADGLKHYVDWAARQGFGVIDVNIPKHLTDEEVRAFDLHDLDDVANNHSRPSYKTIGPAI